MLPGMELMGCTDLAVPAEIMHHVVGVESSYNPFAIGVVGGRLARQPRTLAEAVSTSRMLEREGYNFSLGLAQVNRHNLERQGLGSHEEAFQTCPNLRAGARILAECHTRAAGDWGKAFSCYYSGNFITGFQHGYVQKVLASWQGSAGTPAIAVVPRDADGVAAPGTTPAPSASRLARRVEEAAVMRPTRDAPASTDRTPVIPAPAGASMPQTVSGPLQRADTGQAPVTVRPSTGASTSAPANVGVSTPSRDGAFVF